MKGFIHASISKEFIYVVLISTVALLQRFIHALNFTFNGELFYFPDDSPYHLRRILMLLSSDPYLYGYDPFVAFPAGATPCWHWGFDILIHVVIYPFTGTPVDPERIIILASALIPFLGAAIVPLVYYIAKKTFSVQTALFSGLIIAFFPAHHDYSFFGRIDHHVLEPVIAISIMIFLVKRGKFTLLAGLVTGLSFLVWQSALPFVIFSAFTSNFFFHYERENSSLLLYNTGLISGTAFSVITSPFSHDFVFYSPSILYLTLVLIICISAAIFAPIRKCIQSATFAFLIFIFINGLLLMGILTFYTDFRKPFIDGLLYLGKDGIGEFAFESSNFLDDPRRFMMLSTYLIPASLLPLCLKKLWNNSFKSLIALHFVLSFLLAILQRRFLVFASPFMAIFISEGILHLFDLTRKLEFFMRLKRGKEWLTIPFILIIFILLFPSLRHDFKVKPITYKDISFFRTARFLNEKKKSEKLDPMRSAVLTPWDVGHLFQYEAGLPTLCDNFFGPEESNIAFIDCLKAFYSTNPSKTIMKLLKNGVRFIVIYPQDPVQVKKDSVFLNIDPLFFVDKNNDFTANFLKTLTMSLAYGSGMIEIPSEIIPPPVLPSVKLLHAEGDVLLFEIITTELPPNSVSGML